MTIGGFLLTVLLVGAAFAAWYYFVHRNGVFNPTQQDEERLDRMRNVNGLQRPRAGFMAETGEIGEREEDKAQNGYTPSSYEYMTENRSMSDFDQKSQVPLPRAGLDQDPVKSAASSAKVLSQSGGTGMSSQPVKQAQQSAQVFSTEVGSIGGQQQGQQGQQAQGQSFEGQQVKTARQSAQAFESEIGSIGDNQPQFNEDPSHLEARMEVLKNAHRKYTVEAGEIGDLYANQSSENNQPSNKQQ